IADCGLRISDEGRAGMGAARADPPCDQSAIRNPRSAIRVALVHDYLNQYGGAERVLEQLHALWPDAPVYASMYDRGRMPAAYRAWDIRTTFMQALPGVTRNHQVYLPVYPVAFARLDL